MLEYASMCEHSIIGIIKTDGNPVKKENFYYDANRKINNSPLEESTTDLYDILQDNSCMINLDENKLTQQPR